MHICKRHFFLTGIFAFYCYIAVQVLYRLGLTYGISAPKFYIWMLWLFLLIFVHNSYLTGPKQKLTNKNPLLNCFSGLNLAPVARLRTTWEKLPSKYEKLFQDLQDLFDPSRNMAKYRNVLNSQNLQPPIIPLFPVIKKDLTFLHEGKHKIL